MNLHTYLALLEDEEDEEEDEEEEEEGEVGRLSSSPLAFRGGEGDSDKAGIALENNGRPRAEYVKRTLVPGSGNIPPHVKDNPGALRKRKKGGRLLDHDESMAMRRGDRATYFTR